MKLTRAIPMLSESFKAEPSNCATVLGLSGTWTLELPPLTTDGVAERVEKNEASTGPGPNTGGVGVTAAGMVASIGDGVPLEPCCPCSPTANEVRPFAPTTGVARTASEVRPFAPTTGVKNTAGDATPLAAATGVEKTAREVRPLAPTTGDGMTASDIRPLKPTIGVSMGVSS